MTPPTTAPRFLLLLLLLHFPPPTHTLSVPKLPVSLPNLPTSLRQAQDGDSHGGPGFTISPVLPPSPTSPPATVIMLHGLGSTGDEWAVTSLAMSLFSLNYVKFVIPTASNASVTYLNSAVMPSWFDILRLGTTTSVVNDTTLDASVARINNIIDGEIRAGVSQNRIFLVGFSQGGALALTTFLRSRRALGGCVGVATWLPNHDDFETFGGDTVVSNEIQARDIKMIHGTNDPVVVIQYARLSARRIRRLGVPVRFMAIPSADHLLLTPDVITMIEDYVIERAPGTTQFLKSLVAELTDTFMDDSRRAILF